MDEFLEFFGGLFIATIVVVLLVLIVTGLQKVGDKEAYARGLKDGRCETVNVFILEDTPDKLVIQKCIGVDVKTTVNKKSKEKRF